MHLRKTRTRRAGAPPQPTIGPIPDLGARRTVAGAAGWTGHRLEPSSVLGEACARTGPSRHSWHQRCTHAGWKSCCNLLTVQRLLLLLAFRLLARALACATQQQPREGCQLRPHGGACSLHPQLSGSRRVHTSYAGLLLQMHSGEVVVRGPCGRSPGFPFLRAASQPARLYKPSGTFTSLPRTHPPPPPPRSLQQPSPQRPSCHAPGRPWPRP